MKAKKVPVRMCAGCGGRFNKRDLVRVVRTGSHRQDGRAGRLCVPRSCLLAEGAEEAGL